MSWIEIIADRKIRDAAEEGAFDNLPGKGKPLNLDYDPRVAPEMRAAYRLMKEAQLLPDWIQLDKEVRETQERWEERVARFAETWQPAGQARPVADSRKDEERLDRERDAFLLRAAEGLRELNRMIDRLNLVVPPNRQRLRIDPRERMQELEARFPRMLPPRPGAPVLWESLVEEQKPVVRLSNRVPRRGRRGSFG